MHGSIDINNIAAFLAVIAASGVGVSILAQIIKKVAGMDSGKAIHLMVVLVSGVLSVASYILQYKNLPVSVLGISGPAIYGFSQGAYRIGKILADLLAKVSDSMHGTSKVAGALDAPTPGVDAAVTAFTKPSPSEPTSELTF